MELLRNCLYHSRALSNHFCCSLFLNWRLTFFDQRHLKLRAQGAVNPPPSGAQGQLPCKLWLFQHLRRWKDRFLKQSTSLVCAVFFYFTKKRRLLQMIIILCTNSNINLLAFPLGVQIYFFRLLFAWKFDHHRRSICFILWCCELEGEIRINLCDLLKH